MQNEITDKMVEAASVYLCRKSCQYDPYGPVSPFDKGPRWKRFISRAREFLSDLQPILTAALAAAEAQPVAWHWTDKTGCLFITGDGRRDDIPPEAQPLYAYPPVASTADGWVMVPVEPTEEMMQKGRFGGITPLDDRRRINMAGIWKAMLAARPTPSVDTEARTPLPPAVTASELVEALRRLVKTYDGFEDGDGEPCPDVAFAKAALANIGKD